jgi:nucleoside-diphosphate-sugar epimerase
MKALVTGANGFVGQAMCQALIANKRPVIAVARSFDASKLLSINDRYAQYLYGLEVDFSDISGLQPHIQDIQVAVHCAARVHQVKEQAADPLAEYLRINTAATLKLARTMANAGVKRFIFLSSVKVNGEFTLPGQPFRADNLIATQDPYGISKWEAEQGLRKIAAQTGMEVVIIRPPLVYGPGVKANFLTMMRWLHKGIPLPMGSVHNRRSFVALPNLVDFISLCMSQ